MLPFAPHELKEDGAHIFATETLNWQGDNWELALRDYNHSHYLALDFRREGGGPCLHANKAVTAPLKDGKRQLERDAMRLAFLECQENGQWGRSLYWNEAFGLRQSGEKPFYGTGFTPGGTGSWSIVGVHPPCYAGFYWHQERGDWLSRASTGELLQSLQSAPEFEFARLYLLSSSAEMYWDNAWHWKRGDNVEFERVLTWAVLAQEELWQTEGGLSLHVDLTKDDRNLGAVLFTDKQGIHRVDNPTPLPKDIHRTLEMALRWFGPTLNQAGVDQHLCLSQSLGWGCTIVIRPENFTAHEQIESAVKWHEWLANANKEVGSQELEVRTGDNTRPNSDS